MAKYEILTVTDGNNDHLLNIGRLNFCNVIPFFWRSLGQSGPYTFIDDVPTGLNRKLERGEVDIAPSSSITYGRNSDSLSIHPRLCISAKNKVLSVMLFSTMPIEKLGGCSIGLTPASDTSVALLKILCNTRYGIAPVFSTLVSGGVYDAQLLIGDAALEYGEREQVPYIYDLAEEWLNWKGVPFVFGLWIVRNSILQSSKKNDVICFFKAIEESCAQFQGNRIRAITLWRDVFPVTLSDESLENYFGCMEYHFSDTHKNSLHIFYEECYAIGLLENVPTFNFIQID